jgi:hypothetical protein
MADPAAKSNPPPTAQAHPTDAKAAEVEVRIGEHGQFCADLSVERLRSGQRGLVFGPRLLRLDRELAAFQVQRRQQAFVQLQLLLLLLERVLAESEFGHDCSAYGGYPRMAWQYHG